MITLFLGGLLLAQSAAPATDVVMQAMTDELDRTLALKLPESPSPYYADVTATDVHALAVDAEFGALVGSQMHRTRTLAPTVRVGSFEVDAVGVPQIFEPGNVGVEADYDALRRELWLLSDGAYKNAATRHRQVLTRRSQSAADPDEPASFSPAVPTQHVDAGAVSAIERARYEALATRASAVFRDYPDLIAGDVGVMATATTRRFASSEGSRVTTRSELVIVTLSAAAQAEDGELLQHGVSRMGTLDDFRDVTQLISAARILAETLTALQSAPVLRTYSGPVIFEGRAAGLLIADGLASRLTATQAWGSDFEDRLGQRVFSTALSIKDDPAATHAGTALMGTYTVDAEGVPAQAVQIASNGKLVGLLSTRAPGKKIRTSNGHARGLGFGGMRNPAFSNLVVSSKGGASDTALRKRLLRLARKQGAKSGLIVRDGAHAFHPSVAVRVHSDGREELVRVGFLGALGPRLFKDVVAVGRESTVTNFLLVGGSPSGGAVPPEFAAMAVPASVVAPALLIGDVEFTAPRGSNPKPPAYSRPVLSGAGRRP